LGGIAYDAFDKKYVFCGDYLILKEYSVPYIVGQRKSDKCIKKFSDDTSANNPKRYDNLKRARDTVAAYVYTNLTPHTKFLTLTTADTVLDVPVFQRKLQTFLQAMKRNGYDLDYLYVYERQKERGKKEGNAGSLHAHMIIFNDEYINMDILKKCWPHGRVELKILDGLRCKNNKKSQELIKNPASYVCKYITKESVAEWNEKVFRCSKGLKKPITINNEVVVYSDSGAASKDSERLYYLFESSYSIIFENSKVIRLSSESGEYDRFLKTTVSKQKEL
jgi:hypothetical protein